MRLQRYFVKLRAVHAAVSHILIARLRDWVSAGLGPHLLQLQQRGRQGLSMLKGRVDEGRDGQQQCLHAAGAPTRSGWPGGQRPEMLLAQQLHQALHDTLAQQQSMPLGPRTRHTLQDL